MENHRFRLENVLMLLRIINKLKRILAPEQEVKDIPLSLHSIIGRGTIIRGVSLRLDNPEEGRKYLTIGENCIISGNFIFESTEGEITIGDHSYIGGGMFISRSSIRIGNNVTIAWGGTVYDHDSHSVNYLDRRKDIDDELECIREGRNFIENKDWSNVKSKPIVIKDDAWIGMNVIILKGVTIGRGAIVGAGSVVTNDVPDWCIAAGNPARVVKQLK